MPSKSFEEADKVVHPVEKQWHYPMLTKYGFEPEQREATGLVRKYTYTHPAGHRIVCSTGVSSDHWEDMNAKPWQGGYWRDLEPYLQKLVGSRKEGRNGKATKQPYRWTSNVDPIR